jgi:hypothetical protein
MGFRRSYTDHLLSRDVFRFRHRTTRSRRTTSPKTQHPHLGFPIVLDPLRRHRRHRTTRPRRPTSPTTSIMYVPFPIVTTSESIVSLFRIFSSLYFNYPVSTVLLLSDDALFDRVCLRFLFVWGACMIFWRGMCSLCWRMCTF